MKTIRNCQRIVISKINIILHLFFFCATFFFATDFTASAQDKIITRDAQTIEGTVIEVNPYDIKYKRADNPDGPMFVMEKSEIATIIYSNGSVDVFNNDGADQQENRDFSDSRSYREVQGNSIRIGNPYDGGCLFDPDNPQPFKILNDEWAYGDKVVNYDTIYQILRMKAPDLSGQLMSNIRLGKTGIALFSVGAGIASMGLLFMIADADYVDGLFWTGYGMLISGTMLALPVGVTMWSVGYKRRDRTVREYNARVNSMRDYSSVPEHEFKLIQNKYGVGIAFTF